VEKLTSAEGSLALAITALLLVMGFRLARPARGREWGAITTYATAIVLTLLAAHGLLPGPPPPTPAAPVRIAGAALLVSGLLLAGAAAGVRASTPAGELATTGPYSRVRHPLYIGLVLVVIGNVVRAPSTAGLLSAAAAAVVYASLAITEEREADRAFGDKWRDYAARTPAVFPLRRRPVPPVP
jgi:protein-S-isoprenylcysteine O-methyltransferase Ste14